MYLILRLFTTSNPSNDNSGNLIELINGILIVCKEIYLLTHLNLVYPKNNYLFQRRPILSTTSNPFNLVYSTFNLWKLTVDYGLSRWKSTILTNKKLPSQKEGYVNGVQYMTTSSWSYQTQNLINMDTEA